MALENELTKLVRIYGEKKFNQETILRIAKSEVELIDSEQIAVAKAMQPFLYQNMTQMERQTLAILAILKCPSLFIPTQENQQPIQPTILNKQIVETEKKRSFVKTFWKRYFENLEVETLPVIKVVAAPNKQGNFILGAEMGTFLTSQ
jgi:hypothetical protein